MTGPDGRPRDGRVVVYGCSGPVQAPRQTGYSLVLSLSGPEGPVPSLTGPPPGPRVPRTSDVWNGGPFTMEVLVGATDHYFSSVGGRFASGRDEEGRRCVRGSEV